MAKTWQLLGLLVAVGLVVLPEPITSATGTLVGLGILATMFGAQGASPV